MSEQSEKWESEMVPLFCFYPVLITGRWCCIKLEKCIRGLTNFSSFIFY